MSRAVTVIDHVSLGVRDLAASQRFYRQALAPLGMAVLYEQEGFVAFGRPGSDDFAIHRAGTNAGGAHVAFPAPSRKAVGQFWDAALAAGARPRHEPAIHTEYHPGYYAAFVYDPDGNNIEAVLHES